MSDLDLEHWSTYGATAEEARLLAAARGGGPSAASRARIAGAVGIGVAMASIAPAAIKVPFGVAKWLAGKWIVLAVVGTLTAGAAVGIVRARSASDGPSVATTAAAAPRQQAAAGQGAVVLSAPAPPAETREVPASPAVPLITIAATPATPATPAHADSPRAKTATAAPVRDDAPRPAASSVDAELALLERAKESLDRRRPAAALATVADYEQRHPHGVLAIEAQVIRIEALAQAGQAKEASSAARAFLAAHPNAVQAARVRSLAHQIDPSP